MNSTIWEPQNYSPNLSVEDWKKLLNDRNIFSESDLEVMKRFQDFGGAATCKQLSEKYGETVNFYSNKVWSIGSRIFEKMHCPISTRDNGSIQYWAILCFGRDASKNELGSFVWKLRDELAEALKEIDLKNVNLYAEDKFENALKDNDEKIILKIAWQNEGGMAYFIDKFTGAKIRIKTNLAYQLISSKKAVQIFEEDFDNLAEKYKNTNSQNEELYKANVSNAYTKENFLSEVFIDEEKYNLLVKLLKHKKNIILQGAPGVGKTFAAKRLAYSIIGEKNENQIEFVQFHQNYSYEDFIMGYKPTEKNFEMRTGIFYNFCKKAEENPDEKFFFIIDEINRGNMSKIFGELLMLIEKDHREEKIKLSYSDEKFSVPKNLFIIGMMNTADRSLAIIDYALRRRFSFFEMEPAFDSDGFKNYQKTLQNKIFDKLVDKIKILNEEISADKSLGRGFCIGHSYFCLEDCDEKILRSIVDYEILSTLEEYFFDDENKFEEWKNILRGVFND